MVEHLITLALLILLQAVLGFDNLLYISLESKRVAPDKQAYVRRLGIGLAIFLDRPHRHRPRPIPKEDPQEKAGLPHLLNCNRNGSTGVPGYCPR